MFRYMVNELGTKIQREDKIIELKAKIADGTSGAIYQGNIYQISNQKQQETCAIKLQQRMVESEKNSILKLIDSNCKYNYILKHFETFFSQETNSFCTIMEFAEFGSLFDYIKCVQSQEKFKKLPQNFVLQCIIDISQGIREIHEDNITHRDLKPENILITTKSISNDGMCDIIQVKLTDFGTAQESDLTQTRGIGTTNYQAPELRNCEKDSYDNRVDVWSLGCIWYFLLCQEDLFQNVNQYSQQSINSKISQITSIDEWQRNLMQKMLMVKTSERFNINQVCQELKRYCTFRFHQSSTISGLDQLFRKNSIMLSNIPNQKTETTDQQDLGSKIKLCAPQQKEIEMKDNEIEDLRNDVKDIKFSVNKLFDLYSQLHNQTEVSDNNLYLKELLGLLQSVPQLINKSTQDQMNEIKLCLQAFISQKQKQEALNEALIQGMQKEIKEIQENTDKIKEMDYSQKAIRQELKEQLCQFSTIAKQIETLGLDLKNILCQQSSEFKQMAVSQLQFKEQLCQYSKEAKATEKSISAYPYSKIDQMMKHLNSRDSLELNCPIIKEQPEQKQCLFFQELYQKIQQIHKISKFFQVNHLQLLEMIQTIQSINKCFLLRA